MLNSHHAVNLANAFGGMIPDEIMAQCDGYSEIMQAITGEVRAVPAEILAAITLEYLKQQQQVQQKAPVEAGYAFASEPAPSQPVAVEEPLKPSFIARQEEMMRRQQANGHFPGQQPDGDAVSYEHLGEPDHNGDRPFQPIAEQGREPVALTESRLEQISKEGKPVQAIFNHPQRHVLANGLLVGSEGGMAVIQSSDINSQGFSFTDTIRVPISEVKI